MINLADYLTLLHFTPDEHWQHVLITDQSICQKCRDKPCLTLCPSGVFTWNLHKSEPVLVLYKQCIECGACRLICDNINFSYPCGGCGVNFIEG